MEWQDYRDSENIEDRRGGRGGRYVIGGIGTLILAAVVFFLGGDPTQVLNLGNPSTDNYQQTREADPNDIAGKFVSKVLANTEDVWTQEFQKMGKTYEKPILVLFEEQTESACGGAQAAVGPFYCPVDKKVYLDLSFFNDLQTRFGIEGDFASAYVIAHEIGHHVQDLMGITRQVSAMQRRTGEREANRLSVMLELQADFLAGYWASRAREFKLSEDDIRSALTAANAIGDDKLQKQSQGYVVPDAFTHGTSQQRMEWFVRGFKANSVEEGNTFQAMR